MSVCVGTTCLLGGTTDRSKEGSKAEEAAASCKENSKKGLPLKELGGALAKLFRTPRVAAFFLVVVVTGFAFGSMGSFMFLFLEELGGSASLMGLTMTVM